VQEDLEFFDGALLGVIVSEATPATWQRALGFLTKESDFSAFFVNGDPIIGRMPGSFEEANKLKNECSVLASFHFGRIVLNCHFFTIDTVELDADPREISSESSYLHLAGICRTFADCLEMPVRLCGEGFPNDPIAIFEPRSGRKSPKN